MTLLRVGPLLMPPKNAWSIDLTEPEPGRAIQLPTPPGYSEQHSNEPVCACLDPSRRCNAIMTRDCVAAGRKRAWKPKRWT